MSVRQTILQWLADKRIDCQMYEHARCDTMEDCLAQPFMDETITFCKNVFLCNRQQTSFYLMILRPTTAFRTAVVSKALGVSRLSFAPESTLRELLHLSAGSVSPLGLYFDEQRRVTFCYEAAVRNTERIAFHPCDNTVTVVFSQDVFWNQVLPKLGVRPIAVDLSEQPQTEC